jgi:hypothetical protein
MADSSGFLGAVLKKVLSQSRNMGSPRIVFILWFSATFCGKNPELDMDG